MKRQQKTLAEDGAHNDEDGAPDGAQSEDLFSENKVIYIWETLTWQ